MPPKRLAEEPGAVVLCQGLTIKRRAKGYLAVELHYTANNVKADPRWIAAAKAGMTERGWNREHELSFEAFAGKPVFPEFQRDRHIVRLDAPLKGLPLQRGWDFGYHRPRVVVSQWDGKVWRVHGEYGASDKSIRIFAANVLDWCADSFGADAEYEDFCDPSGFARSDKDAKTSVEVLNDLGIYPTARPGPVNRGIEVIRSLFPDSIVVDASCESLTAALSGGYRYGEDTTAKGAEIPEKDGVYDDWVDALRYAVQGKLGFARKAEEETQKEPHEMTLDEYMCWHRDQVAQGRTVATDDAEEFLSLDEDFVGDVDYGGE